MRVIFCIAHAGITQIDVWSAWLTAQNIQMRVFCPAGFAVPRNARRMPFYFATQWGSPQLVYVLQEGYRHILNEFIDVEMIYLVSGFDIPVGITLEHTKSQIAFTRSGNGHHQNRRDKMMEIRTKDLLSYGLTQQPSYIATQWIHLTGVHAKLIADFPMWKMQLLHSKLRHTYSHYGKNMPVADEYWPWTILTQCGVTLDNVNDCICTQQDRARPHDPSPILWDGGNASVFTHFDGPDAVFEIKSLRDILHSLPKETLFYRKISSAVILKDLGLDVFDK
jgi:hypothetical protein